MTVAIPRTALWLGLAGLIPFLACVLTGFPGGPAFVRGWEDLIMLRYGIVILSFMSGVLWGFATKASGRAAAMGYALSVIPALWAFFSTMGGVSQGLAALMVGFAGLLGLDWWFWRLGVAPAWWMRLRLILTSGVLASLALGLYL
jgi:hypothetical protein